MWLEHDPSCTSFKIYSTSDGWTHMRIGSRNPFLYKMSPMRESFAALYLNLFFSALDSRSSPSLYPGSFHTHIEAKFHSILFSFNRRLMENLHRDFFLMSVLVAEANLARASSQLLSSLGILFNFTSANCFNAILTLLRYLPLCHL